MRKVHSLLFIVSILFIVNISHAQVVISQVYGGGGNSGATLKNDFIEIFNRGTTTVDLSTWSVQYASSAGTTWQRTNLSGSIAAGQYYLIQQAAGTGGTVNLPTPDAIGTIPMSATAGKVVLLNTNSTITSGTSCPSGVNVQDIVGYGTGTNCFEGSGPTATLTNTTAALRGTSGCTDNNNNSTDFATGTPNPRNTASPLNPCTGGISINNVSLNEGNTGTTSFIFTVTLSSPAGPGGVTFDIATQDNTALSPDDFTSNSLTGQTIAEGNLTYMYTVLVNGDNTIEPNESFFVNISNVSGAVITDGQGVGNIINDDCEPTHTIAQIQGSGNSSPFAGASVSINGIVTGLRSNGFFMQTQLAEYDADQNTSEGIFVFTGGTPPAAAAIGNKVCVSGTVTEFIPSADPNSPSTTEIIIPVVIVLSTGNPLPVPVILSSSDTDPSNGIYQLEKYEGMRVQVNSLTVVAPTQGNITESSATASSTGYFYGVITGVNRPFREEGIQVPDALPAGAPATVTRWDANPELIGVASLAQPGSLVIDVATGAVITNITGPLDFTRRYYTIDVDAASPHIVSNNSLTFTAVPAQINEELTVASFNMQRFYDVINDPGGDVVLTATAYNNRLNKVSLAIRNVLRFPDIIGVIEVEKFSVLQDIANKVNADAIAAAQPNPNYQAYLEEGNDPGGIDVGFLVKSPRVTVTDVTQYGKTTTYTNPNNGSSELLNDRPPLVLRAEFNQPGCATPYPVTVIVNHLRSLNDIDDPVDGNRVRVKRRAQAEYLADLIQGFQTTNPNVNIISVGDYNAFQFSDGFVDLIGTIKGTPTPAANVVLASPDLVNPDLIDLVDTHTPDQRYSYNFMGSAQVLDHILVNQNLSGIVSQFSIARMDADFPEIVRNDPTRPERISDHDVPVAYFLFTDTENPNAVCQNITITLANGTASITAADVDGGSTDNCGIQTLSVSKSTFDCTDIGTNEVTLTVTDANENSSTCTAVVTVVGEIPSCSISSIPENNIYTGGVPTNIYLGYGPQSVTLDLTPSGGNSFSYSWSGDGTLSCTDCQDPVFAPTSGGTYQFTATVTNNYGCITTCTITICVLDIRVPGTNGNKVYLCHSPSGSSGNARTLALNVNDVPGHIPPHSSDRLGKCNEFPCATNTNINSGRANQNATTLEKISPILTVAVLPNPSNSYFNLFIQSAGDHVVTVRILDAYGRQVKKYNVSPDSNIKIGSELMNGIYFAEIIQGKERKVIKLVKIKN